MTEHPIARLFEDWLLSRPARGLRQRDGALAEASAQLYRDMWAVFTRHLNEQWATTPGSADKLQERLLKLSVVELEAFLGSSEQTNSDDGWSQRYAWRMLHLIDRVLAFHSERNKAPANRAALTLLQSPPYCFANASNLDTAPELLGDGDVEQLISYLQAQMPLSPSPAAQHHHSAAEWKRARDIACVAVMLGAGLAPSDAQALTLNGVAVHDGPVPGLPWRLTIPPDGLSPQHQSPLAAWAGQLLARWLDIRRQRDIPGPYVFPSTLKGTSLSRMSCHRAVVQVLNDAGISGGVPFRLRNTFAVRQLSVGHSAETVGRWLGLVESKAMRRYLALACPPGTVE